jgi:hypothetical protein
VPPQRTRPRVPQGRGSRCGSHSPPRLCSSRSRVLPGSAARGFLNFVSSGQLVGAAGRRNEAAGWLRRTVGAVAARDLPEEPSEEEFRLGLRNGQILCGALNRVHMGAVPKASAPCARYLSRSFPPPLQLRVDGARCGTPVRVQVVVNTAADSVLQADGAALSAFQYFENVRNFLVAAQEIGLPCFEASDLEQVSVQTSRGGAPPLGFACSCSNFSPHPCFLHTHTHTHSRSL